MALTAEQLQQMDSDSGLTSSKIARMDIDAGISQPQHDDSWLSQIVTPAQLQQWKSKGHIGAIEAFNRFDKWDMLPYVGGMQDGYDIPIAMKIRAAANGDELSTKDKQDVINFIRDYSEIQARGYSFGGNMVNGGLAGVPFLVEAGVALGTGGLAAGGTASKMAAKGGAKAAVGAAVKSVIGKTLGKEIVEQSAEMAGKTIAKNAAIHTMSVLPSVARNTGHRLINSGIAVTDKGEIYAKQAQESPAIIALKALGETEIELASEMSGGLLFHPLTHGAGAVAKSIMPRKLVSALDQLALTKGGKAVSTMLRARDKVGFNGFLEEMGEEAVGGVLKTTFDLDAKEGYSFDQFLDAATFNRGSDLMVTAGLVAIQGGVSIGTVKAVNALAKSGMPQEKIDEVMAHTSELEKENIAERFNEGGSPAIPESEVVVEAPPGVEQTNEFTAAHSFPETPTLFGSVEQNATPQNQQDAVPPTEETTAQRMDNALATESTNQQQKMNDVAKAGETVNLNAVDKARKNKIRSDIKVIDKQLHTLSKQYDDTAKRMAETTDDKAADKIQKELDRIDAQMTKLSDERDAMELDSELVGKTIANAKNEQVQMTREQANDLQRIDKSKRVLRAIKTGFDSGVAMTKASLKIAQKEYSNLVKMLPKTEREKVAFDFKKFNSVEEAKKNLPEFESKIENILKAVDATDKHVAIAKALTQKATIKTGSTKKAAFGVEETAVYRDLQEIYRLRELALKSTEHEKLGEDNKQKRADAQNKLLEMKFNARIAEKTGSFHERIVNRMLSYATTRPENVSVQEMSLLLDDINRLKEEGRTARDEAELEKRLNKSEIVDDVINAVEKYNTKPPGLLKKFYVNNIANVYSVFNAYMGKAFAEKYDPSLAQSKLSNAVYFSTRELSDKITKILNAGRIENLPKLVSEMSELNTDWVIKKIDGNYNHVTLYRGEMDALDMEGKNLDDYGSNTDKAISRILGTDYTPDYTTNNELTFWTENEDVAQGYADSDKIFLDMLKRRKGNDKEAHLAFESLTGRKTARDGKVKEKSVVINTDEVFDITDLGETVDVGDLIGRLYGKTWKEVKDNEQWKNEFYDLEAKLKLPMDENAELTRAYSFLRNDKEVPDRVGLVLGILKIRGYRAVRYAENGTSHYAFFGEPSNLFDVKYGKVARQLSTFDIMDIYNSIKNTDIADDYYKAYGKDQIDGLVSQLTPEQMEMADALAKHVRSYESTLNDYNLRKRGLPLEKRANYWPASSESHGDEYDALNTYIPNSNIPSALKIKYGNTVPVPRNAWQKAQKHIYQAEYVANLADTFETIDTMLKDPDASTIIKQTLGGTVYNNLKSELDFMSLQRGIQVNSEFGNALEKALGRWTAAMVASPRVFLRQFTAATTYSAEENMPLGTWTKYFAEALAHPQRTIEYMRKEIPYLEARFNEGYDEAIAKAIREATHTSAVEQDWTKAVTFFTKTGDIGSIMFGGYPYYRHMLESGISKEEAIDKFIYTTERITQGKESSNLSTLQKDSRINYFSRFLNSPNQFVRQLVDAQIQMKRGEMSKATYAKKMSQYLVMQPVLYSAIGSAYKAAASSIYGLAGGSPDDRDFQAANYFFDIMNQIVLVPFAALPLVNELVGFVLNTVEGQPIYGLFESQMITDMADSAVGVATSIKHENLAGVLFHASKVLTVVGVPVKQITDLIDTVSGGELKDSVSNKKKKSMYSNAW